MEKLYKIIKIVSTAVFKIYDNIYAVHVDIYNYYYTFNQILLKKYIFEIKNII